MATNYCKNCGANLSPESKFCENCGKTVDVAPAITKESYKAPQAPTPSFTPSSRLGAAFWLGLVGAIFGLFLGVIRLGSSVEFINGLGLVIFSILGLVGALRIIERDDRINAGFMLIAGIGVLICLLPVGLLPAVLFFVGAALIWLKKE